MSDSSDNTPFVPAELPSDALVYRGIRRRLWVDEDGVISVEAFFRRVIETGLSVGIDPENSVEDFARSIGLSKVHGALKLKTENIRTIENKKSQKLDVINNKEHHWEIQDVPEFEETEESTHDNRDEAEYLAGELIRISDWHYWPNHLQR